MNGLYLRAGGIVVDGLVVGSAEVVCPSVVVSSFVIMGMSVGAIMTVGLSNLHTFLKPVRFHQIQCQSLLDLVSLI